MGWKEGEGSSCVIGGIGYNGGMESKKQEQLDLLAKKALEHDGRFDKHDKRFDAIDRRFDTHDKKFEGIDKRFDGQDKRLDEHGKQIETLQSSVEEFKKQTLKGQDEMLTILRRLDEERVTADSWLEKLDKDVRQLKKKVGLKGV